MGCSINQNCVLIFVELTSVGIEYEHVGLGSDIVIDLESDVIISES